MGWLGAATLTIAQAATESDVLNVATIFPSARLALTILAPATMPETVTVHIAPVVGGTYVALENTAGNDLVLTAARGTPVEVNGAGALKLIAGVGVAAARSFTVLAVPIR